MLLLVLAGCPNDPILTQVIEEDVFTQSPSNEVDILWVIDDTPSMADEQDTIAASADAFLARLEGADIDFHLGVITPDLVTLGAGKLVGDPAALSADTPDYADAFRARVDQPGTGADVEPAFGAALLALTAPLADTSNAGFLRDSAMSYLIFVSDENDCTGPTDFTSDDCYLRAGELTPVADLVDALAAIKPDQVLTLSGIVGPPISAGCDGTVEGTRYAAAIAMTGGIRGDICSSDVSALMDQLGEAASGILTSFPLSHAAEEDTIEVLVRTAEGDEASVARDATDGWTYDADTARVEFHGDAVPPRGSTVTVTYEVAMDRVSTDSGA